MSREALPYYVVHKYLGLPRNRWIVRRADADILDPGSSFVMHRCGTEKAAIAWMIKMLRDGVKNLKPFEHDPDWKELGDRYRRMKRQLDGYKPNPTNGAKHVDKSCGR